MQFGADPYNMPLVGSVEYQQWLEQVAMHHQIQMMQGQMMQQQIVFTALVKFQEDYPKCFTFRPEMYYYSQQQQQPHPIFGIQQSSQFFWKFAVRVNNLCTLCIVLCILFSTSMSFKKATFMRDHFILMCLPLNS